MTPVQYPEVAALHLNPAFSAVAIIPPGATLVWLGGQNAVDPKGAIVGKGDVIRVQVFLRADQDLRTAYAAFAPVLAGRPRAPLVGVALVAGLAHPDFLIEVGLEAVQP